MYKSQLEANGVLGSIATATFDGNTPKAIIFEVKASEETNGMAGILVCVRAPQDEDASETFSYSRGIGFYDLGEFIPS